MTLRSWTAFSAVIVIVASMLVEPHHRLSRRSVGYRLTMNDPVEIRKAFREATNMSPSEIEEWLETDESKSVGDSDGGESTGHRSGRRIVEIKRKNVDELTDADHEHMNKVVGYVRRHRSQRPDGNIEHTDWRYSLMNWGHDPLED